MDDTNLDPNSSTVNKRNVPFFSFGKSKVAKTVAESPSVPQDATPLQHATPLQQATPSHNTTPFQQATPLQQDTPSHNTTPFQQETPSHNTTPLQRDTPSQNTTPLGDESPRFILPEHTIWEGNEVPEFKTSHAVTTSEPQPRFILPKLTIWEGNEVPEFKTSHAVTASEPPMDPSLAALLDISQNPTQPLLLQETRSLPHQLTPSLPHQLTPSLPHQLTQSLPLQVTPSLPHQVTQPDSLLAHESPVVPHQSSLVEDVEPMVLECESEQLSQVQANKNATLRYYMQNLLIQVTSLSSSQLCDEPYTNDYLDTIGYPVVSQVDSSDYMDTSNQIDASASTQVDTSNPKDTLDYRGQTSHPDTGPSESQLTSAARPRFPSHQFPLLNITIQSKNFLQQYAARKRFDELIEAVVTQEKGKFEEWLLKQGLVSNNQYCPLHFNDDSPLRLGHYKKQSEGRTTSGYIWYNSCCQTKIYVSIYTDSIFCWPNTKTIPSPQHIVHMIYRWAFRTHPASLYMGKEEEMWVLASRDKLHQYLRAVCSVMLQNYSMNLGEGGTAVEVGFLMLGAGSSTHENDMLSVVGVFERKRKRYRLFALEPVQSVQERVDRIVGQVQGVTHKNAVIICEKVQIVNKLRDLGYKVNRYMHGRSQTSLLSNNKIMDYLSIQVPPIFKGLVQCFSVPKMQLLLDELCWREQHGRTDMEAFISIVEHIAWLTAQEAKIEGVMMLLERVIKYPAHPSNHQTDTQPHNTISNATKHLQVSRITMDGPTPDPHHPYIIQRPEEITSDRGSVDYQTTDISSDDGSVDNRTAEVPSDGGLVDNRTEEVMSDGGSVDDRTAKVLSDGGLVDSQTEEVMSDGGIVDNLTAKVALDGGSVDDRTAEVPSDDGLVGNQTEDVMSDGGSVDNRTAKVALDGGSVDDRTAEVASDGGRVDNRTAEVALDESRMVKCERREETNLTENNQTYSIHGMYLQKLTNRITCRAQDQSDNESLLNLAHSIFENVMSEEFCDLTQTEKTSRKDQHIASDTSRKDQHIASNSSWKDQHITNDTSWKDQQGPSRTGACERTEDPLLPIRDSDAVVDHRKRFGERLTVECELLDANCYGGGHVNRTLEHIPPGSGSGVCSGRSPLQRPPLLDTGPFCNNSEQITQNETNSFLQKSTELQAVQRNLLQVSQNVQCERNELQASQNVPCEVPLDNTDSTNSVINVVVRGRQMILGNDKSVDNTQLRNLLLETKSQKNQVAEKDDCRLSVKDFKDKLKELRKAVHQVKSKGAQELQAYADEWTKWEQHYYGDILGDPTLGRENLSYVYTCHICKVAFGNNVNFQHHMIVNHVPNDSDKSFKNLCQYCFRLFPTVKLRHQHQHKYYYNTRGCRICHEKQIPTFVDLKQHLRRTHTASELPYRCQLCHYASSFYTRIIDHFNQAHKRTRHVLCHICLRVFTADGFSFSYIIALHYKNHNRNNDLKCDRCELRFLKTNMKQYTDHQKNDHQSQADHAGLIRYKSLGKNMRPTGPRIGPAGRVHKSTELIHWLILPGLTLRLGGEADRGGFYCIECDGNMTLEDHYSSYMKCSECEYATSCRNMATKHVRTFHPSTHLQNSRQSYAIGPPIPLHRLLYCACGFCSGSGNKLAGHLARCELSTKTAYPHPVNTKSNNNATARVTVVNVPDC